MLRTVRVDSERATEWVVGWVNKHGSTHRDFDNPEAARKFYDELVAANPDADADDSSNFDEDDAESKDETDDAVAPAAPAGETATSPEFIGAGDSPVSEGGTVIAPSPPPGGATVIDRARAARDEQQAKGDAAALASDEAQHAFEKMTAGTFVTFPQPTRVVTWDDLPPRGLIAYERHDDGTVVFLGYVERDGD